MSFTEIRQLTTIDLGADARTRSLIVVWRGAFGGQLEEAMRDPTWPISVLDMLPERHGWAWEIAPRPAQGAPTWDGLVRQLEQAAGLRGPVSGNAVATLRLRTY